MSKYTWVINKDFSDDITNPKVVRIIGPRDSEFDEEKVIKFGKKFRMYDDDMNLYYEGFIFGEFHGFEPLDDYGMPNAGCVMIKYLENGFWKIL